MAITLGLAVVLFIYWVIGADEPSIQREIPSLQVSLALFFGLSSVAAAAFYAQLVPKWWRWPSLALLVAGIAGVAAYYWP